MPKLFDGLFANRKNIQLNQPVSAIQEFSQYDCDYIAYCIEQEQVVSKLEADLHTSDDPYEISQETLKTACAFYGADWAGIIELDLDLGVWSPGWWYNAAPGITSIQKIYEYENVSFMPSWVDAMKRNEAIIVNDIEDVIKNYPQEYKVYKRLDVKSVMAVPFGPNPAGFFVLRNPTRYNSRTSAMSIFAYVMHRAMAQKNAAERAKMALTPNEIKSDSEFIINFFGDMEIYTQDGIWKEHDFNAPKCSRVIAYILLHGKTAHSSLAIADALYPEDGLDIDTLSQNIRGYIYRFRKSFGLISKHDLIECVANGYRLNPKLHVMTDLQKFEHLWELAQADDLPLSHKTHLLKQAIKLYRGSVFESACDDHWLIGIATEYKMKYIGMVNELLEILAEFKDYDGILHFGLKTLKLAPENVKAHYWLVYAMYHSGTVELAKKRIQQARHDLTDDEYATLKKYIMKDETLQKIRLFEV